MIVKISHQFDRIITSLLLGIGMILITMQTISLIWELGKTIYYRFSEAGLAYAPEYGKTVIILFFNVLLALEILETVKISSSAHDVKIRIILLVCLIAISRKVLMLDLGHPEPIVELALAALVIAIAFSYYLVTRRPGQNKTIEEDDHKTE
jgi:uncharacterized membrane protein (DUF373 family)